jgi:hypothetical protein
VVMALDRVSTGFYPGDVIWFTKWKCAGFIVSCGRPNFVGRQDAVMIVENEVKKVSLNATIDTAPLLVAR